MITIKQSGNFNKTEAFFKKMSRFKYKNILERYGKEGVAVLSAATPIDSGKTSECWTYDIIVKGTNTKIVWSNSNVVDSVPIAIILQYGHGTREGGYVEGRDYINPTIKPIFEKMLNNVWKEVTK